MSRRRELAARRVMLVARCERQRRDLALSADGVAHSLPLVDVAARVTRRAASHPLILAGAVIAAIIIIRPRRLLQAITMGLSAAAVARRAATLLRIGA